MTKVIIGVIGPGKGATDREMELAQALGTLIAQQGWVTLCGGRNQGVMDAVSRGAQAAGGLTIGILPTQDKRHTASAVDIAIYTDTGLARNNINVLTSHVVVVCGAGLGTISEVALALKQNRPVIFLPVAASLYQWFKQFGRNILWESSSPDHTIELIHTILTEKR